MYGLPVIQAAQSLPLEGKRGIQNQIHLLPKELVYRKLGSLDGLGGAAGQAAGHLHGLNHELVSRHHIADEANAFRPAYGLGPIASARTSWR